jgi:hypothetical protein
MAAEPLKRPSSNYSRVFTSLTAGLFLVVTGAIGWNVSRMSGLFNGGRWHDGPVWWQIGLGTTLLLLGIHWARRIIDPRTPLSARRPPKWVGRGQA